MNYKAVRDGIAAFVSSLPLPVISGSITVSSVFAPEVELEDKKGTTIEVFIVSAAISKSERKEDQRTRTARVLIRHRLVGESMAARVTEENAYDQLVNDLEKKLVRYVSSDGEAAAQSVEVPVFIEGAQYYQEGVLSSIIDVEVLNFEPAAD